MLLVPAATACPSEVVNAGQEISNVPVAGLPSARKTVSLTVVNAGPCASRAAALVQITTNKKSRLARRLMCNIRSSKTDLIVTS